MPELPEVETTVRGLKFIIGHSIKLIILHRNNLRYPIPKKIIKLTKNSKILSIIRRAKYIIIILNNSFSLVIHLGMSGRLKYYKSNDIFSKNIHDHVEILLSNNSKIIFNDPRRFGVFDIIESDKISISKYFKNLGLDPLDKP